MVRIWHALAVRSQRPSETPFASRRMRRVNTRQILPAAPFVGEAPRPRGAESAQRRQRLLYSSVGQHRVGDFHEAGNVRTPDVVDPSCFLPVFQTLEMNLLHEALEVLIDFLSRP